MGLVGFLVLGLNLSLKAEDVYEEWVARWNGPKMWMDEPRAIAVSAEGSIYVTGVTFQAYGLFLIPYYDIVTIKYSTYGWIDWVRYYNGPGDDNDEPRAIGIDTSGNIYVCGLSMGNGTSWDFITIKYSPLGETLWVRRSDGPINSTDEATAMFVDKNSNVYVTGRSLGEDSSFDYATIKYTSSGDLLWVSRYNGPVGGSDISSGIVADDSGYVYVTGASDSTGLIYNESDYLTIKYGPNGDMVWSRRFDGDSLEDNPTDLTLDMTGDLFVTGNSFTSAWGLGSYRRLTIRYFPNGDTGWAKREDRALSGYGDDIAVKALTDTSGGVCIVGHSKSVASGDDYWMTKYSSAGEFLWQQLYTGPAYLGTDRVTAALVDSQGSILVTGSSMDSYYKPDFATVKYSSEGNVLWIKRYDGIDVPEGDLHTPTAIALGDGNIYVTGYSYIDNQSSNFTTIKYSPCTPSSPKAGDANSDDSLSLSDVISTVNYIFGRGGPRPYPPCDANLYDCWAYNRLCRYDWNGEQKVTLGDCIRAINYIFNKPGIWNPVPSLGCCPFPQNQ